MCLVSCSPKPPDSYVIAAAWVTRVSKCWRHLGCGLCMTCFGFFFSCYFLFLFLFWVCLLVVLDFWGSWFFCGVFVVICCCFVLFSLIHECMSIWEVNCSLGVVYTSSYSAQCLCCGLEGFEVSSSDWKPFRAISAHGSNGGMEPLW